MSIEGSSKQIYSHPNFKQKQKNKHTMDTKQSSSVSESSLMVGKAYCKCGDGWKCEIKRTNGPDAAKTFVKCAQNCICILEGGADGVIKVQQQQVQEVGVAAEGGDGEESVFCECGEGWSCSISRIQVPPETTIKPFAECAGDCSCITITSAST